MNLDRPGLPFNLHPLPGQLVERDTAYWVDALNARDVPSGAILPLREALAQEQAQHGKLPRLALEREAHHPVDFGQRQAAKRLVAGITGETCRTEIELGGR